MAEDIDWTRELKRVEHLRRAGRISEVIDIVRGLVAEDKGRVDLRLILAEALIQRNESLKAMKHIDDALQLDPKNLRALDLKALRLRAQGRDDEAAKVLDKLLELNPRNF
jgi:Flp pilus assembly protein TadD